MSDIELTAELVVNYFKSYRLMFLDGDEKYYVILKSDNRVYYRINCSTKEIKYMKYTSKELLSWFKSNYEKYSEVRREFITWYKLKRILSV